MPATASSPIASRPESTERNAARQPGLDALRAAASLAVVVLHAAVAYMLYPWPDLLWAESDHPSPLADAVGWAIQGCAMPVFFILSGYFAVGLLSGRTPGRFLLHRFQRLVLPLLVCMATIIPLTGYVWVAGWVADGRYPLRKLRSFKFEPEVMEHLVGLGHLWYLQYLFLHCVILAGAAWFGMRLMRTEAGRAMARRVRAAIGAVSPAWLPMLFFAPAVALLWYDLAIVVGFQNTLLPIPTKLAYYSLYFMAGAAARRMSPDGAALASPSLAPLVLGGLAYCFALPLIHANLTGGLSGAARFCLAVVLVAYAWLMAWGLFRLALAWRSEIGGPVRYVAEASYWIYLTHLPIVGLAQVSLAGTRWPSEIKFALTTAAARALTLLTYHAWVRGGRLGAWLDGGRQKRQTEESAGRDAPFRLAIYRGDDPGDLETPDLPGKVDRPRREAA